jgi:hypothetical protein
LSPDSIKDKILVRELRKAGSLQLDKELEEGAKLESAMEKLAKRTNVAEMRKSAIHSDRLTIILESKGNWQ